MFLKSKTFVTMSIAVLSIMLAAGFQNCGKVHFSPTDGTNTNTSICVPGKKLGIWLDDANETFLGDIVTYTGDVSAIVNYGYESASAHPINGPTPIGYELHNFFYEGTDGLMLNFYGNVDSNDGSQGSADNEYSLRIYTFGNDSDDDIVFVDDRGDYMQRQVLSDHNEYNAHFHYWYNTDGAIIGPFNGEDFEIRVQITSAGDLQGARFYSVNHTSFNLGSSANLSYIIRYREYEECK
ncbi:MAG: hypothetical protein KDD37_10840 [Bdellovibrionales bacterium]|nr:hypothetical protein [Bdellovibrionales bacterium]